MKSNIVKILCMLLVAVCVMCLYACGKDADPSEKTDIPGAPTDAFQGTTGAIGGEFTPSEEWTLIPDDYLKFELNDDGTGYKCYGFKEQYEWPDPLYLDKYPYCVIPDAFNGLPVVQITGGWGWQVGIKGISIPESVCLINSQAFCGLDTLEAAIVPGTLTEFTDGVFMNCIQLQEVVLGEGLQYLGGQWFQGCVSLRSITLPKSLVSVSMNEFAGCTALEQIVLQEGLQNIARKAFEGCTSLVSITIPSTVTAIGKGAFNDCTALQEIVFLGTTTQWYEMSVDFVPSGCVVRCTDGDA